MGTQQSSAHIQSLSLQDSTDLDVQLVAVVTAVSPENTEELKEHQRLGQVNLEDDMQSHIQTDLRSAQSVMFELFFERKNISSALHSRSPQEVTSYLDE